MQYSTGPIEIRRAIRKQLLLLMELQRRHENDPPFEDQAKGAGE